MTEKLKILLKKAFDEGAMYESTLSESCSFTNFIKDLETEQLSIGSVVRSISVYSSCEDKRLDYRKDYVFHHFVSKRKALIEDKESGRLMEVHYNNFRFS